MISGRLSGWVAPAILALVLLVSPFVLPAIGANADMLSRILIWGLFGLGFDLIFGYTGLLSFGQSAFYGTGGFIAAYLLVSHKIGDVFSRACHRHGGRGDRRPRRRRAGAAAHRHLLRDDHGGLRGDVLLPGKFAAVGMDRRRERPSQRAEARDPHRRAQLHLRHRLAHVRPHRRPVLRRLPDRAPDRQLALRPHPHRDPRQPAAGERRRPRDPALQAGGVRDRRRLLGTGGGAQRRHPELHGAGRLHLRHVRAARHADDHRRRRHAVRAAGRRRDLAVPAKRAAGRRARAGVEAGARAGVRAAHRVSPPRHHRRRGRSFRRRPADVARRSGTGGGRSAPGPCRRGNRPLPAVAALSWRRAG